MAAQAREVSRLGSVCLVGMVRVWVLGSVCMRGMSSRYVVEVCVMFRVRMSGWDVCEVEYV